MLFGLAVVAVWPVISQGAAPVAPTAAMDEARVAKETALPYRISGKTLGEVVEQLHAITGVRFTLKPGLAAQPVDATLEGKTWTQALREFLTGYNHLAIVNDVGELQRVWITGVEAPRPPLPGGAAARPGPGADAVDLSVHPGEEDDIERPLALWDVADDADTTYHGIPAKAINVDPDVLANLEVGQPLELAIPQEDTSIFAVIEETHSQLNGKIQVWSGPVDGSHETASFTITQGTKTTYVTVATGKNIYEVAIDNESGDGSVVNEVDMTAGKHGDDVVIPPRE